MVYNRSWRVELFVYSFPTMRDLKLLNSPMDRVVLLSFLILSYTSFAYDRLAYLPVAFCNQVLSLLILSLLLLSASCITLIPTIPVTIPPICPT